MQKVLITLITLAIIIAAVVYFTLPNGTSTISHLAPQPFQQKLADTNVTLIDIRTMDEFNAGHLKEAKQLDYYQTQAFSNFLDSLDKSKPYLIYCRTGHRSGLALDIMKQKGFTNVTDLAGGYNAWKTAGLPIEK